MTRAAIDHRLRLLRLEKRRLEATIQVCDNVEIVWAEADLQRVEAELAFVESQ